MLTAIRYCYDLEISSEDSITPRPNDNEVEDFELMSLDEINHLINSNEFKPNCAMVLLDWQLRHGLLTANHALLPVITRLHRRIE